AGSWKRRARSLSTFFSREAEPSLPSWGVGMGRGVHREVRGPTLSPAPPLLPPSPGTATLQRGSSLLLSSSPSAGRVIPSPPPHCSTPNPPHAPPAPPSLDSDGCT